MIEVPAVAHAFSAGAFDEPRATVLIVFLGKFEAGDVSDLSSHVLPAGSAFPAYENVKVGCLDCNAMHGPIATRTNIQRCFEK